MQSLSDNDYDAFVSGEGIVLNDPDGVLGGHHEDTRFNSGFRYFSVLVLGGSTNETGEITKPDSDSSHANTIDPIN